MHTKLEDYTKVPVSDISEEITIWLGELAKIGDKLSELKPVKFSAISDENPLAHGRIHPFGRAAYGVPDIFRLIVRPVPGQQFDHYRSINREKINVTELAAHDSSSYDHEVHGDTHYTHETPFKDGSFIDVRRGDEAEKAGLVAEVLTPETTTLGVRGINQGAVDSIRIPLNRLQLVEFEAVRLGADLVQERRRL